MKTLSDKGFRIKRHGIFYWVYGGEHIKEAIKELKDEIGKGLTSSYYIDYMHFLRILDLKFGIKLTK